MEDLSPAIKKAFELVTGVPWCSLFTPVYEEDYKPRCPPNQENLLIRREVLRRMSAEAKEVMWILNNVPGEIFESFSHNGRISKNRIFNYLKKDGWRTVDIVRTFKELKKVAKTLERYE